MVAKIIRTLVFLPAKNGFKGLLHPKMKILSLFTYLHVVPNP